MMVWILSTIKACCETSVFEIGVGNSQDMETTQMSIDRGLDQEDMVYLLNGILLSHKKEQINAI